MIPLSFTFSLLAVGTLVAGTGVAFPLQAPATRISNGSTPPARLTLVLSVDQFRADYLQRFRPWFGEGGFRRIFQQGVYCKDSVYRDSRTETGPGHSVIGTGSYPHRSGIVANAWRDRKTLEQVYCVSGRQGPSPERLLVPTLAELWKKKYGKQSRILSFSFKDRAAILMAGRGGDGVFWFDGVHGRLRSSPWYDRRPDTAARKAAKAWAASLAQRGPEGRLIDRWLGKTWEELPCPSQDPDSRKTWDSLPPDDRKGESPRNGWEPHFPRRFARSRGPRYYAQVRESPFGNDYLIQCLLTAIDSSTLQLGSRSDSVDLVLLSLSSLDYVGHAHGPWSHEVRDLMLRLDRQLAALFSALDTRIGQGRWTLAVTGDHGVCSTIQYSKRLGRDAGVVSRYEPVAGQGLVRARLGDHLLERFKGKFRPGFLKRATEGLGQGLVEGLCLLHDGDVYLRPDLTKASGIQVKDMIGAIQGFFSKEPYIEAMFRRDQLDEPQGARACQVARSFHPKRSGDLMMVLKPYWLWRWGRTGASHGSPHGYDRKVPLLFLGRGIVRGKTIEGAGIEDLVPTLARLAKVTPAKTCEGKALQGALVSTKDDR